MFTMTRYPDKNCHHADRSFPPVLLCSTVGAIFSLAGVWIITAIEFAPHAMGA